MRRKVSDCFYLERHFHSGPPHPRIGEYDNGNTWESLMRYNKYLKHEDEIICTVSRIICTHPHWYRPDKERLEEFCENSGIGCPLKPRY